MTTKDLGAPARLPDAFFFSPTEAREVSLWELPGGAIVSRVPLSQGFFALLDADDWRRVSGLFGPGSWWANPNGHGQTYATAKVPAGSRAHGAKVITLHRAVMDARPSERVVFRNGCTLDCRRENLKAVSGPRVRTMPAIAPP